MLGKWCEMFVSNLLKCVVCFVVVALLTGCGGGGSDADKPEINSGGNESESSSNAGSTDEDVPFSISFQQSTFALDYGFDTGYEQLTISARVEGTRSRPVFIVIEDPDSVFESVDSQIFQNIMAINLSPSSSLWSGVYSSQLLVHVCDDSGCQSEIGDSPYVVPYELHYRTREWRAEPVEYDSVQLSENGTLTLLSEQYAISEPIRIRTYVPDDVIDVTFSEEMISALQVSDVSREGFEITLSNANVGDHLFEYDIIMNYSDRSEIVLFSFKNIVLPFGENLDAPLFVSDNIELFYADGEHVRDVVFAEIFVPFGYSLPVEAELSSGCDSVVDIGFFDDIIDGDGFQSIQLEISTGLVDQVRSQCTLSLNAQGRVTDTLDIEVVSGWSFSNFGASFFFSEYETDISRKNVSLHSVDYMPDDFTWRIEIVDDWIVVDPAYLSPGQTSNSFPVNINWERVRTLSNRGFIVGTIRLIDESGRIGDTEISVWISTDYPYIDGVDSTVVQAGEPFTLQVTGGKLYPFVRFGLNPISNTEGFSGLVPIEYDISLDYSATSLTVTFDAIEVSGEYELFLITATDIESDLELSLIDRIPITVVNDASGSVMKNIKVQLK